MQVFLNQALGKIVYRHPFASPSMKKFSILKVYLHVVYGIGGI